jgi:hypothetical protein
MRFNLRLCPPARAMRRARNSRRSDWPGACIRLAFASGPSPELCEKCNATLDPGENGISAEKMLRQTSL